MTAEIVIMNREAVAIAADSAGTVRVDGKIKIYNSMNKLFMLSKYEPVGIMIYDALSFMGIPCETIVKTFRENLGTKSYANLMQYADEFFKKLESPIYKNNQYSTSVLIRNIVHETLGSINVDWDRITSDLIDKDSTLGIIVAYRQALEELCKNYKSNAKLLTQISDPVKLADDNGVILDDLIRTNFNFNEEFKDLQDLYPKIKELLVLMISEGYYKANMTGLVIAGFGTEEIFPSMVSINVCGIIDGVELLSDERQMTKISQENPAAIQAFAQQEMVDQFIDGMDPRLDSFLKQHVNSLLDECDKTGPDREKLYNRFFEKLSGFTKKQFTDSVYGPIQIFTKTELATMAETLVSLTSFKRLVTFEDQTVGGPIDVAVISKGDGFIWVKRKHYFQPELNQHFFKNYYTEKGGCYEG